VHFRFLALQLMQPFFDRLDFVPRTSYWQGQSPLLHWLHAGLPSLHLIFISQHRMHLPFTGIGGTGGSTTCALLRDADGERGSLPFLLFFAVDLRVELGEAVTPFSLRFLLTEARGASGEVDMSMFGSRQSFSMSISAAFFLRFAFPSLLPFGTFDLGAREVEAVSTANAGRLRASSVYVKLRHRLSGKSPPANAVFLRNDIPIVIYWATMDWIVLVHHVDCLALGGELDMNGTSTTIAYDCRVASIVWVTFAFFAVLSLLFPLAT
jgi:hypothetical protein